MRTPNISVLAMGVSQRVSTIGCRKPSVLGFACWLLLITTGILGTEGRKTLVVTFSSPVQPIKSFRHMEEKVRLTPRPASDVNYMSKRKVPNGPDPIHNRRAGNSRQPPGQAQDVHP